MPNGTVFNCQTCHISAGGGGARNAFGNEVALRVAPGSLDPFWTPALAALDSDGDGFTNGQEVGDPDGDGTPVPGAVVTNPGDPTSKPAVNGTPAFTSTAVLSAVIGTPYSYQATASDPEGHARTFSKIAGPSWLGVSSTGLASGTPPDGSAGTSTVTLRVTDNGSPPASADQSFPLTVTATFAGWQNLHFNLPGEQALAGLLEDPDGDGVPNVVEYALRADPRSTASPAFPAMTLNGGGQLQYVVTARGEDAKLSLSADFANEVSFIGSSTVAGTIQISGQDKVYTLADPVAKSAAERRFGRLKVRLDP